MKKIITSVLVATLMLAAVQRAQAPVWVVPLVVAGVGIAAGVFTVWLVKASKDKNTVNCPAKIICYASVTPKGEGGWTEIGEVVILSNCSTNWIRVFDVEIEDRPGYFFKVAIQPLPQQITEGWVVDVSGPLKINLGQAVP
jgi:hypothetical protein